MPNGASRAKAPKAAAAPAAAPSTAPAAAKSAVAPRVKAAGKPAVRLPAAAPPRKAGGARAAAPETPGPAAPPTDPRLQRALDQVKTNASRLKKHPPAADKAAEAQAAAQSPENERLGAARAGKVEEIGAAEGGKPPEEGSFLAFLEEEIKQVMPKTVHDADTFLATQDERDKFGGKVAVNINEQKKGATAGIRAVTQSPLDATGVPEKEVTPLPPEALPSPALAPVGARDAMPAPLPEEQVSLRRSKEGVNRQLADNKITPPQLTKANDPRFTAVLRSKEAVERHADAGPPRYRQGEQKTLSAAVAGAVAAERRDVAAMRGAHTKAGGEVMSRQEAAKARDEARRKEVADHIEKSFNDTKQAVEDKLNGLEKEVTDQFNAGLAECIRKMTEAITARKDAWKKLRYGELPLFNVALWTYDEFRGIEHHEGIVKIYQEEMQHFTDALKLVVRGLAGLVEKRLKEAKDEVEKGRKRIHDYVEALPKDLQEVGRAAEQEVSGRFDELRQSVEDKKRDLAQSLARRYKEAHDTAAEAVKKLQAEDKGLVDTFAEKLGEVVEILRKFRERVSGMLRKAEETIDLIVADPIGFLKNLLEAVKRGLNQFVGRIWEHLKAGFMAWLFGSLAQMGLEMPKDFSLPSILKLVLDVLGITAARIRGKVAKIIGERNMALLTAAWEAVEILIKGGPAALWERIKEYFSNLRETIVDAIQDWLVTSVIRAAVTKLATMFNPVGAIVQAIITIYNTVMFFIERINQILDFVEAVINSVHRIATGALGPAADWIEKSLARTIPIIIGFLARLLGLSGLADKIKGFILRVQTRVDQAIDRVIDKIVGAIKGLFAKGGKPEQQKATTERPNERLDIAMKGLHQSVDEMQNQGASTDEIEAALPRLREKFGFRALTMKQEEEELVFSGEVNPLVPPVRKPRPGSYGMPFFLTWYKPRYYEYPPLYFGGVIDKPKSQSVLQGIFRKGQNDETGQPVREYLPGKMQTLPDRKGNLNGPELGIAPEYQIVQGAIVGPLRRAQTPGGKTFNRPMARYGWVAGNEGRDADHVHEIQMGGKNVLSNLWPLDETLNSAAGNALKNATVAYKATGKPIKLSDLKDFTSRKYYFKITKFEAP